MNISQNIVKAQIRLKTDTLEVWNNIDPIIPENELIFVTNIDSTDSSIYGIKLGNGLTSFKDLPYLNLNKAYIKKFQTSSLEAGINVSANGTASIAHGYRSVANGDFSVSLGSFTKADDNYSFVWNGNLNEYNITKPLSSNGIGTFTINPVNNISGFYIGSESLYDHIKNNTSTKLDYTNSTLCSITLLNNETQTSSIQFDKKYRICFNETELEDNGVISKLQISGMPDGINLPKFASIDVISGDSLIVTGSRAKVSYVAIPYIISENK